MPSDVLSALLGLLAGGAQGYTETKEGRRKERLAAGESEADRASRERLQSSEFKFREKEGAADRLSRKEETTLKLQADRDNLDKQLRANLDRAAAANGVDRDRLALQRDELNANISRIDRQLALEDKKLGVEAGLKGRELDIDQAAKLGTGKLGAGVGAKGEGINVSDLVKAYISSDQYGGKDSDVKFLGFLKTAAQTDFFTPTPKAPGSSVETPGATFEEGPPAGIDLRGLGINFQTPALSEYNRKNTPSLGFEGLIDSVLNTPKLRPRRGTSIKTLKGH